MPEPNETRYGRGAFLLLLAGGGSAFFWASKVSGFVSPLTSSVSQLLGNLFPIGGWRIYTISGSMPIFDERSWRLEVGGLVGKPRTFTYQELAALPRVHEVRDFHCVTGWTVRKVRWSGVRLSHLLDWWNRTKRRRRFGSSRSSSPTTTRSRSTRRACMTSCSRSSWTASRSRPHGSPVRVVIPEMYGYKGVKWLTKIELLDHQPTGYWEGLGYDQNAWVGRSNGYNSA